MFKQITHLFLGAKEQTRLLTVILGVLVIISGSVGFGMFVCEEFLQLLTFAAFSYTSCDDWSGLESHIVVMKQGHRMANFFIRYFGVLCPLMWVPYTEYVKANAQYIRTMERRIEKEMNSEFGVRNSELKSQTKQNRLSSESRWKR